MASRQEIARLPASGRKPRCLGYVGNSRTFCPLPETTDVRLLKSIGWAVLFVVSGLVGSLAILIGATFLIGTQSPVSLPSGVFVYTDAWDRGYLYASGTWTMENSRQAFPIQTSKITLQPRRKVVHECSGGNCIPQNAAPGDIQLRHHEVGQHRRFYSAPLLIAWNTSIRLIVPISVCSARAPRRKPLVPIAH